MFKVGDRVKAKNGISLMACDLYYLEKVGLIERFEGELEFTV